MPVEQRRLFRVAALCALTGYCFLLLVSAIPTTLLPGNSLTTLKRAAGYGLHLIGVTPGIEVFHGRTSIHAIHQMNCFRITAAGDRDVVLYDDLALCQARKIQPVRDPFRIFQMRNLSQVFVHLNLKQKANFAEDPLRFLFLFADYYCHTPQATEVNARSLTFESLYVGLNLDDGTTGEVKSNGHYPCNLAPYPAL